VDAGGERLAVDPEWLPVEVGVDLYFNLLPISNDIVLPELVNFFCLFDNEYGSCDWPWVVLRGGELVRLVKSGGSDAQVSHEVALGLLVGDQHLETRADQPVACVRPGHLAGLLARSSSRLVEIQLRTLLFLLIIDFSMLE
jgi:hypothetical protein